MPQVLITQIAGVFYCFHYCKLKQILSAFELSVHRNLVDKLSLRLLNSYPRDMPLSKILNASQNDITQYPIEKDLTRGALQISTYCEPLDLELERKEIPQHPERKVILPSPVRYDSIEDLQLLIKTDEYKHLEKKPFLTFDLTKGCVNEGKEYGVMRAIDSFLNSEGGLLIIGVDDRGNPIGLDADYSYLSGDRGDFDKFRNHLQKLIRDRYFKNSIVEEHINIQRHDINGKDICLVDIERSPLPIFVFHRVRGQEFDVRYGDSSRNLERAELSEYLTRHFCTNDRVAVDSGELNETFI